MDSEKKITKNGASLETSSFPTLVEKVLCLWNLVEAVLDTTKHTGVVQNACKGTL
jgi:hypothetical protein